MREEVTATDQRTDCAAAVARIASIASDTRWIILVTGALLTADLAGAAIMMAALLGLKGISTLGSAGLLVMVLLSWVRTSVLVVLAEQPVAAAFGELRRVTGAPVELSVPWSPLGVRPMAAADLAWDHVVPLIAAATLRHRRARLALSWAVITTIGLCVWMAFSLAIAALTG